MQEDSETNSHEWEGLSEVSTEDKQIDVIYSYQFTKNYDEGQILGSRPLEKDPQNIESDSYKEGRITDIIDNNEVIIDLDLEGIIINLENLYLNHHIL